MSALKAVISHEDSRDSQPLTLEALNQARTDMGYPAMTLDGTLVSTYPDNIERWLRRPYGDHKRHFIETAATGQKTPCPCAPCVAKAVRVESPKPRRRTFEEWVDDFDAAKAIRYGDIFFGILFGLIIVAFGALMVGGLIRMIAESIPQAAR